MNILRPSAATPPGATLTDLLEERDITQAELAIRMGLTPKFINELVGGKVSITPTIALALERALDVPADFWLARDARYQEAKARADADIELKKDAGWLDELPLNDMREFGWIRVQESPLAYVNEGLKFFGVSSVNAWRQQYVTHTVAAAARGATDQIIANTGSVATWLRAGELQAAGNRCEPFDRHTFLEALHTARSLSLISSPDEFIPKLTAMFAACGIVVAFVRAPRGCPVNGAVRWLSPQKALVQLSFGYRTDSDLWSAFFHHCGHIALHGKKMLFLEDGSVDGDDEREADRFAADKLISPADWTRMRYLVVNAAAIRTFASEIGIAPGIVLGRLQKEGRVTRRRFNELKVRYAWRT